MSEKRTIKDLSLDIKGKEAKELSLNINDDKKKKITKEDYLNAPTPEGPKKKKPIDSSIYSRKIDRNKWSTKKRWWVWGTTGTVAALSLGLGLGLGLGLRSHHSVASGIPSHEGLEDWVHDQIMASNEFKEKQLDVKKEIAIIWKYDQLLESETFSDVKQALWKKENAHRKAIEDVDAKKDELREQYGDTWKKEFDTFLLENGYDSEDEFKQSLQARSLQDYMVKTIYNNEKLQTGYIVRDDAEGIDATDHMFHSTEYKDLGGTQDYADGDKVRVIFDGTEDANEDGDTSNDINFEELFHLYLLLEQPMATETVQLNYTWLAGHENGLQPNYIDFGSVDDMKNFFMKFRGFEDKINFYSATGGGVTEYNGGIQSSKNITVGGDELTNAITFTSLFGYDVADVNGDGNADIDTTKVYKDHTGNPTDDILQQLNADIKTITDKNGLNWEPDTELVIDDDFNMITENMLEEIEVLFSTNLVTKGFFQIDSSIQKNNVVQRWVQKGTDNGQQSDVYSTWSSEGLYLYRNAFLLDNENLNVNSNNAVENIIYWDDNVDPGEYKKATGQNKELDFTKFDNAKGIEGASVIGGRMVVDELNRSVDKYYHRGSVRPTILSSFNSWLSLNIEDIIFNELLVEAEGDQDMIDEYFTNEMLDGSREDIYQSLVNKFYNNMYQKDNKPYIEQYASLIEFYEENDDVYYKPFIDEDAVSEAMKDNLTFFIWNYSNNPDFKAYSITQMIEEEGDLTSLLTTNP